MKNKREVLVKLFLSTLYLSAFTFGGGYVIITLMKKKFVDDYHWIEENESWLGISLPALQEHWLQLLERLFHRL